MLMSTEIMIMPFSLIFFFMNSSRVIYPPQQVDPDANSYKTSSFILYQPNSTIKLSFSSKNICKLSCGKENLMK